MYYTCRFLKNIGGKRENNSNTKIYLNNERRLLNQCHKKHVKRKKQMKFKVQS